MPVVPKTKENLGSLQMTANIFPVLIVWQKSGAASVS